MTRSDTVFLLLSRLLNLSANEYFDDIVTTIIKAVCYSPISQLRLQRKALVATAPTTATATATAIVADLSYFADCPEFYAFNVSIA